MDLMKMMSKAKEMQSKMQEMQDEVAAMEVEASTGGGLVTVRLSVGGEMRGVSIDPSLAIPDEVEILEDLIVAAYNDARTKASDLMQEKTQELMGGLGLPPGMKLPF